MNVIIKRASSDWLKTSFFVHKSKTAAIGSRLCWDLGIHCLRWPRNRVECLYAGANNKEPWLIDRTALVLILCTKRAVNRERMAFVKFKAHLFWSTLMKIRSTFHTINLTYFVVCEYGAMQHTATTAGPPQPRNRLTLKHTEWNSEPVLFPLLFDGVSFASYCLHLFVRHRHEFMRQLQSTISRFWFIDPIEQCSFANVWAIVNCINAEINRYAYIHSSSAFCAIMQIHRIKNQWKVKRMNMNTYRLKTEWNTQSLLCDVVYFLLLELGHPEAGNTLSLLHTDGRLCDTFLTRSRWWFFFIFALLSCILALTLDLAYIPIWYTHKKIFCLLFSINIPVMMMMMMPMVWRVDHIESSLAKYRHWIQALSSLFAKLICQHVCLAHQRKSFFFVLMMKLINTTKTNY